MTIEVTRRQLMASAGGMVLASFALPSNLRKIIEGVPPARLNSARATAPISEIKHVVVLMQENRSFDHYFGAMPGVRGFGDPQAIPGVFKQADPQNPDGYLYPFHADTHSSSAQALPSTSHSWLPQHYSWDNGAMDGFVTARLPTALFNGKEIDEYDGLAAQYSMAYFQRDDIPFQWALADAFTICDGYHCSVLGPTWPNRLYLMTGQIDPEGTNGGPTYGNYVPTEGFSWKTYPEYLTEAGVSWKVYQETDNYGFNVLEYFDQYQNASTSSPLYQNAMKFYQPGQFEYDAMNDRLPTVSYILPTSYQSEHPDFMPAAGADYVASKVNAIAANPDVWAKTLFILIYDENDGYFDHVLPPTAPTGTAGEYIPTSVTTSAPGPIGLGFRVPCILVSPWTVGGFVCHDTFDHTSVTQLLEKVTGVVNPNITAWRRQTVGDFSTALGMFPTGRFPRLPDTKQQLERAEEEVVQFQLPPYPGANQTPPVQPTGYKPVRNAAAARSVVGV
ncbi:MAG TPA: alkaline phosphatase family protein [Streptosporangiaceae bacterium]|nr:alkaline phosphatase family protein [Streptosporangiaceae bacterium]